MDLSGEMLNVAEKTGVYRQLETADLCKDVRKDDNTYDAVVCVGTMTTGHVGPSPALSEFARITKPGGGIIATILPQLWQAKGFEAEVQRLAQVGTVQVVSTQVKPYRRGQDAHYLVLRVL
jgi:ubiquinone/menaquinone biosynthesis C-methylase UbiE